MNEFLIWFLKCEKNEDVVLWVLIFFNDSTLIQQIPLNKSFWTKQFVAYGLRMDPFPLRSRDSGILTS